MLKPEFSGQFKRDYKLAIKRGCDPKKLEEVVSILCREEPLPPSYRDHALTNSRNYKGMRDLFWGRRRAADGRGGQRRGERTGGSRAG